MVFSGTVNSDFLKLVGTPEGNRSDLINYTANDFYSLKNALINYIKSVYPLDYNNFVESDLGIMLLELVAYMGAVTSLKSDLLVNENFIRTARNRNNIKKLLELIGVRMKGPISAAANAKITLATAPWSVSSDYVEIQFSDRVKQITSPEDGGALTYTLYKVGTNGLVDLANSTGNILLNLTEATDFPSVSGQARVFDNLVILEGAFVREQGTFTSPDSIKSITLSKSPVVEQSVQVFVNGNSGTSGVYSQVENVYFASGSNSKIFQLISNENFAATVVFGDDTLGLSPVVGDTYTLFYRVGGGTRGNIQKEILNTPATLTKMPGAVSVNGTLENTSQGTGGSDAETVEHAKRYAPLTFRRQDRIVTLEDFRTFANTFISQYGSTGKATASVRRAYGSANIIDIYVLEKASTTQLRKATPTFKNQLLNAIAEKKMLTDEVIIVDGLIRTVDLVVSLRIDKKFQGNEELIKLKARDKILSYFNVDNNDFGKSLIANNLIRSLFDISEIRFSTIDNYNQFIPIDFNEIIQLNNLTLNCILI